MPYKLRKCGREESDGEATVAASAAAGSRILRARKVATIKAVSEKILKAAKDGVKIQKVNTRKQKGTLKQEDKNSADGLQVQDSTTGYDAKLTQSSNLGIQSTCVESTWHQLRSTRMQTRRTKILHVDLVNECQGGEGNTSDAFIHGQFNDEKKEQQCEAANNSSNEGDEYVPGSTNDAIMSKRCAEVPSPHANAESSAAMEKKNEEEVVNEKATNSSERQTIVKSEEIDNIVPEPASCDTSQHVAEPLEKSEEMKIVDIENQHHIVLNTSEILDKLNDGLVNSISTENQDDIQIDEASNEQFSKVPSLEAEDDAFLTESNASDWSEKWGDNPGPPQKKRKVELDSGAVEACNVPLEESKVKIIGLDQEEGELTNSPAPQPHTSREHNQIMEDFAKLKVVDVLRSEGYNIELLAEHETLQGKIAINLKKTEFDEKKLGEIIAGSTNMDQIFSNDIFSTFFISPPQDLNKVLVRVVYPIGENFKPKIKAGSLRMVTETASQYKSVSEPYLRQRNKEYKRWIYNILDGVSEAERVVLRDADPKTGFVLLPDLKWTGEQLSDLYCQAIVNRRDLASLRDLTGDCLPLLRNIRDQGTRAICEKYGVQGDQLYAFVHYLPSVYHLHVHFTALTRKHQDVPLSNIHSLSTVISNLELDPQYYRKCTLSFVAREYNSHPLCRAAHAQGSRKSRPQEKHASSRSYGEFRREKRKRSFHGGRTWHSTPPAFQRRSTSAHNFSDGDHNTGTVSCAQGGSGLHGSEMAYSAPPTMLPGPRSVANAHECEQRSVNGSWSLGQTPYGPFCPSNKSGTSAAFSAFTPSRKSSVWSRLTELSNDNSTVAHSDGSSSSPVAKEFVDVKPNVPETVASLNVVEITASPCSISTAAVQDNQILNLGLSDADKPMNGDDKNPVANATSSKLGTPDSEIKEVLTENLPVDTGTDITAAETSKQTEAVCSSTVDIKKENCHHASSSDEKTQVDDSQYSNESSADNGPDKPEAHQSVPECAKKSTMIKNPTLSTVASTVGNPSPGPSGINSERRSSWAGIPTENTAMTHLTTLNTSWIQPSVPSSSTWIRSPAQASTWIRPHSRGSPTWKRPFAWSSTTWIRPSSHDSTPSIRPHVHGNTSWVRPPGERTTWSSDARNNSLPSSSNDTGYNSSGISGPTSHDFTGTDRALVRSYASELGDSGPGKQTGGFRGVDHNFSDQDSRRDADDYAYFDNSPHNIGNVLRIGEDNDDLVSLNELQRFIRHKQIEARDKREAQRRTDHRDHDRRYESGTGALQSRVVSDRFLVKKKKKNKNSYARGRYD